MLYCWLNIAREWHHSNVRIKPHLPRKKVSTFSNLTPETNNPNYNKRRMLGHKKKKNNWITYLHKCKARHYYNSLAKFKTLISLMSRKDGYYVVTFLYTKTRIDIEIRCWHECPVKLQGHLSEIILAKLNYMHIYVIYKCVLFVCIKLVFFLVHKITCYIDKNNCNMDIVFANQVIVFNRFHVRRVILWFAHLQKRSYSNCFCNEKGRRIF